MRLLSSVYVIENNWCNNQFNKYHLPFVVSTHASYFGFVSYLCVCVWYDSSAYTAQSHGKLYLKDNLSS